MVNGVIGEARRDRRGPDSVQLIRTVNIQEVQIGVIRRRRRRQGIHALDAIAVADPQPGKATLQRIAQEGGEALRIARIVQQVSYGLLQAVLSGFR